MATDVVEIPVTSSAKEALVFANTPSFLMRRLQSDPMVQYASQFFSEDELLSILTRSSRDEATVPEDLLQSYVALIALSVMGSNEAWAQARAVPLSYLPWSRELIALAEETRSEGFTSSNPMDISLHVGQAYSSSWDSEEVTAKGLES